MLGSRKVSVPAKKNSRAVSSAAMDEVQVGDYVEIKGVAPGARGVVMSNCHNRCVRVKLQNARQERSSRGFLLTFPRELLSVRHVVDMPEPSKVPSILGGGVGEPTEQQGVSGISATDNNSAYGRLRRCSAIQLPPPPALKLAGAAACRAYLQIFRGDCAMDYSVSCSPSFWKVNFAVSLPGRPNLVSISFTTTTEQRRDNGADDSITVASQPHRPASSSDIELDQCFWGSVSRDQQQVLGCRILHLAFRNCATAFGVRPTLRLCQYLERQYERCDHDVSRLVFDLRLLQTDVLIHLAQSELTATCISGSMFRVAEALELAGDCSVAATLYLESVELFPDLQREQATIHANLHAGFAFQCDHRYKQAEACYVKALHCDLQQLGNRDSRSKATVWDINHNRLTSTMLCHLVALYYEWNTSDASPLQDDERLQVEILFYSLLRFAGWRKENGPIEFEWNGGMKASIQRHLRSQQCAQRALQLALGTPNAEEFRIRILACSSSLTDSHAAKSQTGFREMKRLQRRS